MFQIFEIRGKRFEYYSVSKILESESEYSRFEEKDSNPNRIRIYSIISALCCIFVYDLKTYDNVRINNIDLILRKQVFFFDISKNVRGIYEILCAARYMSNELIFQISASWVIGKHPGGKFCEMQFLQCKMTQIGHFQGMIKRVSRGCLMVSIILTRQDMSIFR